MADGSIVDRLVVAVTYAHDKSGAAAIQDSFKGLAKLAGAAGVAMLGMAMEAAHAGDEVAKAAKRIGLSAEELSELEFAAQLSGAAMTDIESGFRRLADSADQAQKGVKEASDAFREVGVDPSKFDTMSDLFMAVAEGLETIDGSAKRMALSQDIFGRGGSRLLPLLDEGADGIAKMRERLHALGGVIDDEASVAAERLVDDMLELGVVSKGLSRRIGFSLAPALSRIVGGFNDWFVANGHVIGQRLDVVVDGVTRGLDAMATPLGRVATGIAAIGTAWVVSRGADAFLSMAQGAGPIGMALAKFGRTAIALGKTGGPLLLLGLAIDDLWVAMDGGDSVIGRVADSLGVGSEFDAAMLSARDLAGEVGLAFKDMGISIVEAFTFDIPGFDLPDIDLGGLIERFGAGADIAAAGLRRGREAREDPYDPSAPRVRIMTMEEAVARSDARVAAGGSPTVTINANANVTAGASAADVADAAAAEVHRQVLAGVEAVGVAP